MAGDVHTDSADPQDRYARRAARSLVWAEDAIYTVTGVLLGISALVVLAKAVYDVVAGAPDGVLAAIETSFEALLIVFILVELLAAVRIAITEHQLVGEPFLLVGILAAIKELVGLATFKINDTDAEAEQIALKIGVLGGVILVLAAATWILRRREREPEETESG